MLPLMPVSSKRGWRHLQAAYLPLLSLRHAAHSGLHTAGLTSPEGHFTMPKGAHGRDSKWKAQPGKETRATANLCTLSGWAQLPTVAFPRSSLPLAPSPPVRAGPAGGSSTDLRPHSALTEPPPTGSHRDTSSPHPRTQAHQNPVRDVQNQFPAVGISPFPQSPHRWVILSLNWPLH